MRWYWSVTCSLNITSFIIVVQLYYCCPAYRCIYNIINAFCCLAPTEFYIRFSISNTYGKDIDLKTSLEGGLSSVLVPAGQSLNLNVTVGSRDRVKFEAFERDSGNRVRINDEDVYWITPRPNKDKLFILDLPGFLSMCYKIIVYIFHSKILFSYLYTHKTWFCHCISINYERTFTNLSINGV